MARDNFSIENAITIIKSVRHLDVFDTKTAFAVTDLTINQCRETIAVLKKIRAIDKYGDSARKFVVCDNAIQLIKSYADDRAEVKVVRQKAREFKARPMKFVDKANVSGMGNPMLMKFDSLLSGVRV
ncbi:hypothetical protein [Proteus genomosp. 4]|uniref:hypothetical protein n=1 Tax=Proteus genomosp. 4 TaxID=1311818 RepID=UPI000D6974FD|nr:hypothetical protein [Proteus genomosp. 4]